MSIRQMFPGSIVKPGFNPLAAQTSTNTYFPYLYSWGKNQYGQLGLGNTTQYSSPKQIGSLSNWLSVACGSYSSTSVKTDGTLWSWGYNDVGQLGLGNTTNYSSPKQVGALTNWSKVANGSKFCISIKTDGTLWSWGNGNYGQLGFSNSNNYSSPKQVGSLTTWSSISCGTLFALATQTNGTLWAWGNGGSGQLGLNNLTNYSSPKQVGALTNWLNVSCGNYFTLAVKTDGTLWSWGYNGFGQLGLNTATTYYSSPKQIGSLTTWLKMTAGYTYAFGITTAGALWSWGRNNIGQLGLGNTTNYSSPKQVGALTNWATLGNISNSGLSSSALKTDGTLWMWGLNANGRLGLNSATYSFSSPTQVGALTTWLSVSLGNTHGIATLY